MLARFGLIVLSLALLAGCDTTGEGGEVDLGSSVEVGSERGLEEAYAEWLSTGPASYRLQYQVECFCAPVTVTVDVEDGRIVGAETEGGAAEALDVSALYGRALSAYRQGAASITVRLTERGPPIPVDLYIDYNEAIADEEMGYHVLSFESR